MKRSKKSELLIGVMIGLYGNWLIAIVEKLEKTGLLPILLFAFSFVPFIFYFQENFSGIEKQTWLKWIPLKTILGSIYVLLVFGHYGLVAFLKLNLYSLRVVLCSGSC